LQPDADPLLADVTRHLAPKLADFGTLLFGEALAWSVKELWVNVLEHGGMQAMHNHANSFVSGVIYLTPTHVSAHTVFIRNPGSQGFVFSNTHAKTRTGPFNADKWVAPETKPGDLVLFPSYLLHEVPANQGGQRISLAFNAIPERLDSWGYTISLSR